MLKNKLGILGLVALGFGLLNLFWYIQYSLALVFRNQPFPFEYLQEIDLTHDGIGVSIWYEPFNAIQYDPYWLIWSLSLYSGITILSILGIMSLRQKTSS